MSDAALVRPLPAAATPVLNWPSALSAFLLILWLIPIKSYRLPLDLPFDLEVYRLFLFFLGLALAVWVLTGGGRIGTGGQTKPLALLVGTAVVSQLVNYGTLNAGGNDTAFKQLSYFLSFLLAFTLITSTITRWEDIDRLVRVLVFGSAVVALGALYEAQTNRNIFDGLDRWIPFLVFEEREVDAVRGGRLRVRGSAQHPIALSVALTMVIPLAIYLAGQAASTFRRWLWVGAALLAALGAFATVSKTTVIMFVLMALVALRLRGRAVSRYWPLLILLPFVIHFVTPGALGGIRNSFFPQEGTLISGLNSQAGEPGSGRLADLDPGLRRWEQSPLVGHGLGSQAQTGQDPTADPTTDPTQSPLALMQSADVRIIFDNQYLHTLVELGLLGLIGVVWFVFSTARKLGRRARSRLDSRGDLIAACAAACVAFGGSLLLFDAFAFVQATMVFFVIAAIGLRARELAAEPA